MNRTNISRTNISRSNISRSNRSRSNRSRTHRSRKKDQRNPKYIKNVWHQHESTKIRKFKRPMKKQIVNYIKYSENLNDKNNHLQQENYNLAEELDDARFELDDARFELSSAYRNISKNRSKDLKKIKEWEEAYAKMNKLMDDVKRLSNSDTVKELADMREYINLPSPENFGERRHRTWFDNTFITNTVS